LQDDLRNVRFEHDKTKKRVPTPEMGTEDPEKR
jgi:hypothetical protein